MSLLIENFENAYNSYVTAWQSAPVKMATGHLTAAVAIGAGIYFRKDISVAASKCMSDIASVVKASKFVNTASDFASKSIASATDLSKATIGTVCSKLTAVKDTTVSSAKTATTVALKTLNTAKNTTVSFAETAKSAVVNNVPSVKNAAASLNSSFNNLANIVREKAVSFKM